MLSLRSILAVARLALLPSPASLGPLVAGVVVGLATAVGFGFSPLLKLPNVSVLGILRGEEGVSPPSAWLTIGLVVLTIGGLIFWQADETVLTLWVLGLIVCLVLGLTAGGWLILSLVMKVPISRPTTRYAISAAGNRRGVGVMQIRAFGLGITAMLMVTVMRMQLMDGWTSSLPRDTPNRFLTDIQPS